MSDPVPRLNAALEGRYAIERELGEGGMATVYLAKDLRHNRNVALKVLKPELAAVVGAERFLAEIKVTANLQHPHILPLFDSGEADGFLFYVMPFVEGETLRDRIDREKQLPVGEAVRIATAVANAIDHAHRHKVIHRDIKPANILLQDGEPVVADFGIALAVGAAGSNRLTETGLSLGTPYYMSPEQATGDQAVGASTDTYALGSVLYEMLTGDPPYMGSTAQAVLGQIIAAKPISVTDKRPAIPANVDAAVRKALEKLPADRFAGAQDFARSLGDPAFRHREDVSTVTGTPTGPWNRSAVALGVTTVVFALAAVLGWMDGSAEPRMPLFATLDFGAINPDVVGDIVVSPDGTAFVTAGSVDGVRALYYRRGDEPRLRMLPGTENGRYPAFSPGGESIVYRDATEGETALRRISTEGGAPVTVLPSGVLDNPLFPHWADDGTILFNDAAREGGVYRIGSAGGEPQKLLVERRVNHARLLPGGRAVLLTDPRRLSVVLFDIQADSLQEVVSEGVDATYVESGHILYAHPDGGLFAVPFDLQALEVTGQPVLVFDDVRLFLGGAGLRAVYSVSNTGTLVVESALAPDVQRLFVAHRDGVIEDVPLAPRFFGHPRWSPDGRAILYSSEDQIFSYSIDLGTQPLQLTSQGVNTYPVWSPDGARIAFTSRREESSQGDVYVKSLVDDAPPQLLLRVRADQNVRDWPEDDLIVFDHRNTLPTGPTTELWMSQASTGATARRYLAAEANVDNVGVSPNGGWAAYQSDRTGQEEVYVRAFPDPGPEIPVSDGAGLFARWSPDGDAVYYWAGQDQPIDTLWEARVQTDPTFAVLSREPVLARDYLPEFWDVHPDGDRFLVARSLDEGGEAAGRHFQVVINFFEVLRERLGN